jgi:SAM-dependent methyltransferase
MHRYSYFDTNWLALKLNDSQVKKRLPMMTGTVYDLGCGRRPYEHDILQIADDYIGVDWSNTVHGLHADIVADLNQPLPIESSVANTVVSFQVLEHLSEPQSMLNEAYRILCEGGAVIISVPFQWWVHEAPYDYFRYTRYGLEHMLTKAGFVDVQVEAVNGFWVMWFLKLNYHTYRYIRGRRVTRLIMRMLLTPLWFAGQVIAPLLDKIDFNDTETAGYYVTARKR